MRTRPLGNTGLTVSELALGTWGLSGDAYGPVDPSEQDAVIDRALELGITLFDTADTYGDGAMEQRLGARLGGRGTVVTKVGTFRGRSQWIKKFDADYVRSAVAKSAERLKRSKIDVVLLHNPTESTLMSGEASGVLADMVERGTIGAWGASVGDENTGRVALAAGAKVIEIAYSAFCRHDLPALASEVQALGAGVMAHSVLAYGMLAGMILAGHTFADGDHRQRRWDRDELETRVKQLDAVRPLVTGDVLSLRAAALRFVLVNDVVSSAVLGPRSVSQLEQLVREAGDGPPYLSPEALQKLSTDLTRAKVEA